MQLNATSFSPCIYIHITDSCDVCYIYYATICLKLIGIPVLILNSALKHLLILTNPALSSPIYILCLLPCRYIASKILLSYGIATQDGFLSFTWAHFCWSTHSSPLFVGICMWTVMLSVIVGWRVNGNLIGWSFMVECGRTGALYDSCSSELQGQPVCDIFHWD